MLHQQIDQEISEQEAWALRRPYKRLSEKINTASAMKTKTTKYTEPILEIGSLIE